MRFGGIQFFGFDGGPGGIGGTGSVPIANNQAASPGFRFDGFGGGPGGMGGTGSVPIAKDQLALLGFRFDGFGGGPGGMGGTGSVPIANNPGLSAAATVPETARRSETAVRTTSNASRTVSARFFIEALQDEIVVPASRHRHTGEPKTS
jgi:hypothetical protein